MPDIPALVLPGTVLAAADPYDAGAPDHAGIFAPAVVPTSLEILNGGMDTDNYAGGTDSIEPWACQVGSFVQGINLPFDQWIFAYGLQLTAAELGAIASARIVPVVLATSFYLPWDCEMVEIDFHCYARQDASEWNATQPSVLFEYFDMALYYDGAVEQAVYTRFPHGRSYLSAPATDPPDYYDGGLVHGFQDMAANRWRYAAKTFSYTHTNNAAKVAKGLHLVKLTLWAFLQTPDQQTEKLLLPSGGLSVVAYRRA